MRCWLLSTGGYWRALDKSDYSFVAAPFVKRGVTVALINYALCPAVHVQGHRAAGAAGVRLVVAQERQQLRRTRGQAVRVGPLRRWASHCHDAGRAVAEVLAGPAEKAVVQAGLPISG